MGCSGTGLRNEFFLRKQGFSRESKGIMAGPFHAEGIVIEGYLSISILI
jgi:hypothetical protein